MTTSTRFNRLPDRKRFEEDNYSESKEAQRAMNNVIFDLDARQKNLERKLLQSRDARVSKIEALNKTSLGFHPSLIPTIIKELFDQQGWNC